MSLFLEYAITCVFGLFICLVVWYLFIIPLKSIFLSNIIYQITISHGKQPSSTRLYTMVIGLAIVGSIIFVYIKQKTIHVRSTQEFYQSLGIKLKRITRTALEIERKAFHLTGLMVPLLYEYLMKYHNWNQLDFTRLCWLCTIITWSVDYLRIMIPNSMSYFPFTLMNRIIREKEKHQLSGTCYFGLGCTLAITFFPPAVAIVSIMWLVLGDMTAALIGVSFGGETIALKMGRQGKKSVEGSLAMFISCMFLGTIAFANIYLGEYAVCIGSIVATIVELYEPFGLNDNITIPVMSCIALQWSLSRIKDCVPN